MYLLTNIINMLISNITSTFLSQSDLSGPSDAKNTNTHAQFNSMWLDYLSKWRLIRDQISLYFFIVSADIISILVDQNFTMNATGMMLESL